MVSFYKLHRNDHTENKPTCSIFLVLELIFVNQWLFFKNQQLPGFSVPAGAPGPSCKQALWLADSLFVRPEWFTALQKHRVMNPDANQRQSGRLNGVSLTSVGSCRLWPCCCSTHWLWANQITGKHQTQVLLLHHYWPHLDQN